MGRAVGIDLGTTNSARHSAGSCANQRLFQTQKVSAPPPSVVAFTKDDNVLVGETAKAPGCHKR